MVRVFFCVPKGTEIELSNLLIFENPAKSFTCIWHAVFVRNPLRVYVAVPGSHVRIHDLRHTFASLLVSGGASLEMIGRLLGHTQIDTTQRLAHLIDSPLRAGVNAVGEMLKPRLRVVGV